MEGEPTVFSTGFPARSSFLMCLLAFTVLSGCQKSVSGVSAVSAVDAGRKNPLEATPPAIDQGQKLYSSSDCSLCHGKDGEGKGVLAKDINMNTHNWRDPNALRGLSDGELFSILAKGKGRMPGYEMHETPDQLWQMILYIRSLAGK